jgi:hypothetical protein
MSGRAFMRSAIVYTRDARVPLVADDWDFDCGWQNILLPPTLDDHWVMIDNSHDRRTGWIRREWLADWGCA